MASHNGTPTGPTGSGPPFIVTEAVEAALRALGLRADEIPRIAALLKPHEIDLLVSKPVGRPPGSDGTQEPAGPCTIDKAPPSSAQDEQHLPPLRPHANFLRLASRYVVPAVNKVIGLRASFDIETDGLRATCVHCIVIEDLDSNRIDKFRPDQIDAGLARLAQATCLVGHNILNFDLSVLQRLHGWTPAPTVTVIDTLIASRLVLANIGDLDD
jgi:hypothetical protein